MSDAPETEPELLPMPADIGVVRTFPRPVVWTAGMIIVALAAFGLYQGVRGALSGGGAGNGQGDQLTSDAVSAAAAAPISGNPQWSALNGPAMGAPAAPKAASSAAAAATSTDNADNSSADDSTAPAAVSAAPPAPVVSAQAPAPPPAPAAESAQPAAPQ